MVTGEQNGNFQVIMFETSDRFFVLDSAFKQVFEENDAEVVSRPEHVQLLAKYKNLQYRAGLSIGEDIEKNLFLVDAETSSVRSIRVRDNYVSTIAGKGLFDFGDVDGKKDVALLQHPLDIAYDAKRKVLWVADSYNHKLRHIKISNGLVSSVKLSDKLHEPAGLSLKEDVLYIADTNAHRVCSVDLNTGQVQELEIFEVETD